MLYLFFPNNTTFFFHRIILTDIFSLKKLQCNTVYSIGVFSLKYCTIMYLVCAIFLSPLYYHFYYYLPSSSKFGIPFSQFSKSLANSFSPYKYTNISTGLLPLRQQLISDVLKHTNIKVGNIDQGIEVIWARICSKKVHTQIPIQNQMLVQMFIYIS